MRSDSTFAEEMESVGGIPGVLYESLGQYDEENGRPPLAGLDVVHGSSDEDLSADPGSLADQRSTAPDLDGRRWLQGTPYVVDDIDIRVITDKETGGPGKLNELIADRCGIDVETAVGRALRDHAGRFALAEAVTDFGTESLGEYLPWHAFARSTSTPWGMYFFPEALIYWAADIWEAAHRLFPTITPSDALWIAFYVTYRHELFHFHVERFAIRQEVLQRRPVFRPYLSRVRRVVTQTEDWLEEALAQAVVLSSTLVANRVGLKMKQLRDILRPLFDRFPDGYRHFRCKRMGGVTKAHKLLGAQVVSGAVDPGFIATELATPKREYGESPSKTPGYLVFAPKALSRFQLPRPARKRCKRYLRGQGWHYIGPGPGDHERWKVNGHTIHVNFRKGEADLASLKAIAGASGMPVAQLVDAMLGT